jgi:hypothetical protein
VLSFCTLISATYISPLRQPHVCSDTESHADSFVLVLRSKGLYSVATVTRVATCRTSGCWHTPRSVKAPQSHTMSLPSMPAVAARLRCLLKPTASTESSWPAQQHSSRLDVCHFLLLCGHIQIKAQGPVPNLVLYQASDIKPTCCSCSKLTNNTLCMFSGACMCCSHRHQQHRTMHYSNVLRAIAQRPHLLTMPPSCCCGCL